MSDLALKMLEVDVPLPGMPPVAPVTTSEKTAGDLTRTDLRHVLDCTTIGRLGRATSRTGLLIKLAHHEDFVRIELCLSNDDWADHLRGNACLADHPVIDLPVDEATTIHHIQINTNGRTHAA